MSGQIKLPFMNSFIYADGDSYAVDFYNWTDAPDYADLFREGWTGLARAGAARPRSTLLFFTRCEGCGFEILTNRDRSSSLRCRWCGTRFAVIGHSSPALDRLLERIHDRLGRTVESIAGHRLVVLLQPLDPDAAADVAQVCRAACFVPLDEQHPVAANLFFEGIRRGILEHDRAHSVWEKEAAPGATAYAGETAPELEDLLRAAGAVTEMRSLSSSYDPQDDSLWGLAHRGDNAGIEGQLRDALAADPSDADALELLVETLIAQGKLDEAAQNALAATELQPGNPNRWTALGRVEMRRGRTRDAVAAFERALAIDPLDRLALAFLIASYDELGETDKAHVLAARLRSIGGPI